MELRDDEVTALKADIEKSIDDFRAGYSELVIIRLKCFIEYMTED